MLNCKGTGSAKGGLWSKNIVSHVRNVQNVLKVVFVSCTVDGPGNNTNSFAMVFLHIKPAVTGVKIDTRTSELSDQLYHLKH